ncbi:hypothetical protein [Prescottella agglutinans]|uniref:Uncharacterized protein n=1 Tax=Prescottella agglutinans TaxID=1644129 RepID=A0ABT6MKT3_9NOCA|nr:hypothetical protein [Prescottella agglutinans]MDH6284936.1 hypothetical protein [Prescottella agglutinans]
MLSEVGAGGSGLTISGRAVRRLIGLLRISSDHAIPRMWAFVGVDGARLFGHWVWALKHKLWRNQIALSVFSLPVLDAVAPIPTNRVPRQQHDVGPHHRQWGQQQWR